MKVFARLYDVLLWPIELLVLRPRRRRISSGARGRVLEIGVGTWLNLPFYAGVEHLIGLEPDEGMLIGARRRVRRSRVAASLIKGSATELPFPDGAFDVVVGTLVCCSIPDPVRALRECRRVLRRGGELRLLEHGLSNRAFRGWLQRLFAPLWRHLFGGCHLDRDPPAFLEEAGFRVRHRIRRETWGLAPAFCLHEMVAVVQGLEHAPESSEGAGSAKTRRADDAATAGGVTP